MKLDSPLDVVRPFGTINIHVYVPQEKSATDEQIEAVSKLFEELADSVETFVGSVNIGEELDALEATAWVTTIG